MQRIGFVWVGAAWLLVSIGYSQFPVDELAGIEARHRARAILYEEFLAGNSREALERLLALPAPEGISTDLFLLKELTRLSLEFRNGQEPEAAARVAAIAVDLLSSERVSQLQNRAERAEAWRMRARIHELILPDRAAARAAWQKVLDEEPEDEMAANAIRRIDERAAFAKRRRDEGSRDPMGSGFVPAPVPAAVNP